MPNDISRFFAKYSSGMAISSFKMYCQTSISVQLEMVNTLKFSPMRFFPLNKFQSFRRWFLGSY